MIRVALHLAVLILTLLFASLSLNVMLIGGMFQHDSSNACSSSIRNSINP